MSRYEHRTAYVRKTEVSRDSQRSAKQAGKTHVHTEQFTRQLDAACERFFASRQKVRTKGLMGQTVEINVAVGTRSPNAVCRRWRSKANDPPPPTQPWTPNPEHGKRLAALALAASRQLAALIAAGRATPPSVDTVTGESLRRSSVDPGANGGVSGGDTPVKGTFRRF